MATKKTTAKAEETKATAAKTAETAKTETKKAAPAKKEAKEETKKAAPAKKEAKKETKKAAPAKKEAKKETKKAAPAKKAAKKAAKKPAEKAILATTVKGLFFEYGDKQIDATALAEMAKEAFKANGGKGTVKSIELYVKAEDNALYYVINGKESGKVEL